MDAFRNADIPPSARAMSLVRKHHGLTSKSGAQIPEVLDRKGNAVKGGWRKEAAANHLNARRRRLTLAEIREEEMPVILEVNGGRNFVILCEKVGDESFMVQFPDARESVVTMSRLNDVYDGWCILLSPRRGGDGGNGGDGGGRGASWFQKIFRGKKPSKSAVNATLTLLLNSAVLAGTLWLVKQHGQIFDQLGASGSWVSTFAGVIAAMIVLGLSKLRSHLRIQETSAQAIDCAFVPLMLAGVWLMSELPAMVFVASALVCGAYLFFSKVCREVTVIGRLLFSAAFAFGGLAAWVFAAEGMMSPAVLTGVVVLGAYLARVLLDGAHFWPKVRLA